MTQERSEKSILGWIIYILGVALSLFIIYANSFGTIPIIKTNAAFASFSLALCFLLTPSRKGAKAGTPVDILLAIIGAIGGFYLILYFDDIAEGGMQFTTVDILFAAVTVIVVMEAARRSLGWVIPVLCILFLLYAYLGPYLPGVLNHRGFRIERILSRMYYTPEGIFGITTTVANTFVFLFILFGAFLERTGVGGFFNDFAIALTGSRKGGPAQVATVASALMGTISGSAAANVATTGSFTIPMMKKIGYSPTFAGAVEAAASTGGMIMPPVMGAAAFIMAGFLGVPYVKIMLSAIIPALLYYLSIWVVIDLEARKKDLKGLPREQLPSLINTIKTKGYLVLPVFIIIYALISGWTPSFSALMGLACCIIVSMFNPATRMYPGRFFDALDKGARQSISVNVACIVVGIIVGVVTMTGLGTVISHNLMMLSGGRLWLAAFLIMLASLLASMALPATALYVVVATIAAPGLILMGSPPLAAHFFVFWFGCISGLTPPVALTSYTAAGLAGSEPWATSWAGFKLAFAGFIIPYMLIYNPTLLLLGNITFLSLIAKLIPAIAGTVFAAVAFQGYLFARLSIFTRFMFLLVALLTIEPSTFTDILALIILFITIAIHRIASKKGGK